MSCSHFRFDLFCAMVDVLYVQRHAGIRLSALPLHMYCLEQLAVVVEEELGREVSTSVLREWMLMYGSEVDVGIFDEAHLLESAYGAELRAIKYASPRSLCSALRYWTPALRVPITVAEHWVRSWGRATVDDGIYGARRLEEVYGAELRRVDWERGISVDAVLSWLVSTKQAAVSRSVCRAWLEGVLTYVVCFDADCLDAVVGGQLGMTEYENFFGTSGGVRSLLVQLETELSVRVTARVLRQWYERYHWASGGVVCRSVDELEAKYGTIIRGIARSAGWKGLHAALGMRKPPLKVAGCVFRAWVQKYIWHWCASSRVLESLCGSDLRAEYGVAKPLELQRALRQRWPPVICSRGVCTAWRARYAVLNVGSVDDLEAGYGDFLRLFCSHERKLDSVLRWRVIPVIVTGRILRAWCRKYGRPASKKRVFGCSTPGVGVVPSKRYRLRCKTTVCEGVYPVRG